jgi:hypothetical protein
MARKYFPAEPNVPNVPTVPKAPTAPGIGTVGTIGTHSASEIEQHDEHVSVWMDWEERAAIVEFDRGMIRGEAERLAAGFTDTSQVSGLEPSSHHAARA